MLLESLNYVAAVGGIVVSLIVATFSAGFYFNKKVKAACTEENKEIVDAMTVLSDRVKRLETEYVPVKVYEKDLTEIKDLITRVHDDVKAGVTYLTSRIDSFMTLKGT